MRQSDTIAALHTSLAQLHTKADGLTDAVSNMHGTLAAVQHAQALNLPQPDAQEAAVPGPARQQLLPALAALTHAEAEMPVSEPQAALDVETQPCLDELQAAPVQWQHSQRQSSATRPDSGMHQQAVHLQAALEAETQPCDDNELPAKPHPPGGWHTKRGAAKPAQQPAQTQPTGETGQARGV